MQAAFPFVMIGAIVLFVLLGVLSMLTRNNLYDQIGQGGLSIGEEQLRGLRDSGGAGAAEALADQSFEGRDEREQEIRQMLQARSDRLVTRATSRSTSTPSSPRSIPAGVGGVGGSHDSGLALEVRQLVVARNERRRARASPRSTSTPRSRARSPSSTPERTALASRARPTRPPGDAKLGRKIDTTPQPRPAKRCS